MGRGDGAGELEGTCLIWLLAGTARLGRACMKFQGCGPFWSFFRIPLLDLDVVELGVCQFLPHAL